MGEIVGPKHPAGRRPFEGDSQPGDRETLMFTEKEVERLFWMKNERGAQKGRSFLGRVIRGRTWKVVKPKRAHAPDPDE